MKTLFARIPNRVDVPIVTYHRSPSSPILIVSFLGGCILVAFALIVSCLL